MQQMTLFNSLQDNTVVNVASVPQRSPFRYPGGKTWLVPHVRQWLAAPIRQQYALPPTFPTCLIEPFAGGGITSLTAVAERFVEYAIMVEIDDDVAAVWQTIVDSEDWLWLTCAIESFELTYENVKTFLASEKKSLREQAFSTILRNRVNRGGILAPGAGLIKNGEGGKGLRSRWYPTTLRRRIENIIEIKDYITFVHGDGIKALKAYTHRPDAVFFIDPPYTAAGKKAGCRLYRHFEINHEELFEVTSKLQGDFLMTYDENDMTRQLARQYGFDVQTVPMKNSHHAKIEELLVGRNLDWLRHSF